MSTSVTATYLADLKTVLTAPEFDTIATAYGIAATDKELRASLAFTAILLTAFALALPLGLMAGVAAPVENPSRLRLIIGAAVLLALCLVCVDPALPVANALKNMLVGAATMRSPRVLRRAYSTSSKRTHSV